MLDTFTEAVPLRCFRHFRDNLFRKLSELNVAKCGQEEILKDVFGGMTEDELHLGLVDSEKQDIFKAKLASLKDRWNMIELSNRKTLQEESIQPEFHDWFCPYKAENMSNTMIKSVRDAAGLSSSDGNTKRFYTNGSVTESLNQMLKDKVHYKASHLHKFIDEMCDFVKRQENDMKKAVCRVGDWCLHLNYGDLQKSDDWMKMSTTARQTHLKVFSFPLRSIDISIEDQGGSEEHSDTVEELDVQLSCGYEKLLSTGIHESTLSGIWKKASKLVNTEGMILPVPGNVSSSHDRMVASTSGSAPHIVKE